MPSRHHARSSLSMPLLLAGFAAMTLAACSRTTITDAGIGLHGGQTTEQLAQARSECIPFVLEHPETTTQLAEGACLIARGFQAPVTLAFGSAPLGSLYVAQRTDAVAMVKDFQSCRLEARDATLAPIKDELRNGIVVHLYDQLFPKSGKQPDPDGQIMQAFGACLKNRGYVVSNLVTFKPQ